MTASVANGFGHILYTPTSSTCQVAPYAFHPEYSTGNPRGNTWSAHTYNVAYSDEIGHFENCLKLDANFNCAKPGKQECRGSRSRRRQQLLRAGVGFVADQDRRLPVRRRRLGLAVVLERLAGDRSQRRRAIARCTRALFCSPARRRTTGRRTTPRSPSRPTCLGSRRPTRRTTRRSATRTRARTA